VKSSDPDGSDLERSGAGKRKGGRMFGHRAQFANDPIDDRAGGTATQDVRENCLIILRRLQRLPVQRSYIRFGTKKVGGSHLHARSAKHEGGGNSTLVGDPAGCDDRHTHRIR
jgi:hypothetical protein